MKCYYTFLLACALLGNSLNLEGQTRPISINWYRIPYANGTAITMGNDFIDHAGGVSGANAMDMWATSTSSAQIVAAADGVITQITDNRSGCRCASDASCGNNIVIIQHVNNEFSLYFHLRQNSVRGTAANQAGLSVGSNVVQGQFIGIEGDVGFTCFNGLNHPNGTTNRLPNLACSTAALQASNCFQHLHFEVWRGTPFTAGNTRVNPKLCTSDPNIIGTNYIFDTGQSFVADACNMVCPSGPFDLPVSETSIYKVYTSSGFITSHQKINSSAGIEYQANNIIHLTPGFKASSGSFFRASLQNCSNPLPFAGDFPPDGLYILPNEETARILLPASGRSSQMLIRNIPNVSKAGVEYSIRESSIVKLWLERTNGEFIKLLVDNDYQDQGNYLSMLDLTSLPIRDWQVCISVGDYQECKEWTGKESQNEK